MDASFGDKFKVHLGERLCSCQRWQFSGIACAHAISGIFYLSLKPENYVDQCYHKKNIFEGVQSCNVVNTWH